MSPLCRVFPHEAADGPANMALDEALLDAVAAHGGAAYLRTYTWTVPTLSLGYFQQLALVRSDPRWRSVPIVRRLTGGGAIWHHHELTYALILPATHPSTRPHTAVYRAVHGAIARVLGELGVLVDRRAEVDPEPTEGGVRPLLCFADLDPEDLVYQGFKLVGRRTAPPTWGDPATGFDPSGRFAAGDGAPRLPRSGGGASIVRRVGRAIEGVDTHCTGSGIGDSRRLDRDSDAGV